LEQLDERSDIYSLGGILYALLTLRPPVEGKTLEEVLEKVRTGEVVSPSHFGATAPSGKKSAKGEVLEAKKIKPLPHIESGRVPAALSSVVMKALTLDKAARYQSVPEFAADIEKYQTGFATTAEEAGLFTQLRLLVQRHRREFAVGFAAWLIITTLAVWFVFNLRAKEQRATQAEALAVQEKETARQALAKSQLDLAEKEFERGKFVEAQKIIGETPESFRDANWRFLHAHSRDFTSRIRERNAGPVHRIQFFPQGDRFAVKCYRGSLGKEALGIFTLESKRIGDWIPVFGEASKSDAVGIDGTGDRISFAASAKEIAVQEVATGRALRRWTCEEEVSHVLLSPDGGTVLAVVGNQVIAYATETGAQRWMHPSTGAIPDISPDGRTVAVLAFKSGLDFKVQILDTVSGDVHRSIEGASNRPIGPASLQFSRVGNRLACFHGDEITYWNASDGARFRTHLFPGETVGALSPSGDVVATFSGNSISLWDSTTGQLLRSLNGSTLDVMNLAFSPDGKWILSSHDSAENLLVQVWPTRLGEEVVSVRENAKAARWVAFNHDGSEFYTGGQDSGAWGTHTGLQKCKFPTGRLFARGLAVHPTDGSILLSELDKKTITHLSSAGEVMGAFGGIQHNSSVTFSHNGQLVLSVASATSPTNAGYAFSVQEYPSGKELRKVTFEKPGQPFAAFCLDDAVVATAALTGGITVWDWKAGKPLRQIDAAQTGSIACLASSPDSRHLASGGPDRWIRVWEAATGRMEAAFRAHWEGVRCVKFSPDGSEILSGSEDGTVRIHDAASGEERLALYGLTTPVADVDLSADGKLIAAISKEDGVAKVWDRQRSSTAALLGQGVITKEPVAAQDVSKRDTPSAPAKKPKPTVPNAPAVAVKGVPDPATASADALIAAGRTSEAIPLLEKASISQPGDAILAVRLAALQAWFGMDAELAATRQRMLDWAPTATDPESVRHFARVACLRPLADESQRQATLATARLAVEKGNNPVTEPMRRLTLGMAEYRSGHYLAADAALNAAVQAAPVNPAKVMIEGTANYYRVMSLFHQGKTDEARTLFAETEAKMPRLPADEKNPLATVSGQEKLILWLACKEAKALLAEPYTTPK
jgi:WD40 repeat protein